MQKSVLANKCSLVLASGFHILVRNAMHRRIEHFSEGGYPQMSNASNDLVRKGIAAIKQFGALLVLLRNAAKICISEIALSSIEYMSKSVI